MPKQNERRRSGMTESRSLIKSTLSFSWAMSLFAVRQMSDMLRLNINPAAKRFNRVSTSAVNQLSRARKNESGTENNASQSFVSQSVPANTSDPGTQTMPERKVNSGLLNTGVFVTLGEGLAAGVGDFTLQSETQRFSFPALMAQQMQARFKQPLLQAPGLGNLIGFTEHPVLLPNLLQTTVLESLPPVTVQNLSIPNFRLKDALKLRPRSPLVHRHDLNQTFANLILGLREFACGEKKMPTQMEAALAQQPTFTLIELGYYEALEAAVQGAPHLLPSAEDFHFDLAQLLTYLHGDDAKILLLTIPNPLDTAYFSDFVTAAKILKVEPTVLTELFGARETDFVTVKGLHEISFQIFARTFESLPEGSFLDAETAYRISAGVRRLNEEIIALAAEQNAPVFDLNGLFYRIKTNGMVINAREINAEYLGGFYSLNGYYPGATGHALIANELLYFLNRTFNADFPQIDLRGISEVDPVFSYKQADGAVWTLQNLPSPQQPKIQTSEVSNVKSEPEKDSLITPALEETPPLVLRLPPNLEQTLPLNKDLSYFGDGIGAVNCLDPRGIQWGSCGSYLFGGLAMVDSHLSGYLQIKFSPPENNLTCFEVSFLDGLVGDDAVLTTPRLFKMAFQQPRVDGVAGTVSSGTLNLATGEVSDLKIYARYSSTALYALVSVNPTFPQQPLMFPGQYGSTWARFEPRDDGLLDFTFYGSTFVPLGQNIKWPLNFMSSTGQFATIPANGTTMHPHLSLSTRETARHEAGNYPDIPFDTVQEYALITHNSSFGDQFTLSVPQLGGNGKGRSHILGRALIQFGSATGNSVPIAITLSRLGGAMDELEASPIVDAFPGRLTPGAQGFDEFLRFPQRTFSLDDLAILSDPFDISVGAIDLRTGGFLNDLLHRGFINQDLIFALMRVEPRTPRDSFFFRGPAQIEKGKCNQSVFRFQGIVHIPYPNGFYFPQPNLTTAFIVGPDSSLDPFLWIQAIQNSQPVSFVKEGGAKRITASVGEVFSYRYRIPADPEKESAYFEYVNHTQKGAFKMHSLAWVDFCNSRHAVSAKDYDTVSFTCFGIWTKDGVSSIQQASVQISTASNAPYVGIQIDNGAISNANLKPESEESAIP